MAFQFKLDNPVAKIGWYVMVPLAALGIGYSILSQTCAGDAKPPVQEQVVDASVDAPDAGEAVVIADDAGVAPDAEAPDAAPPAAADPAN